MIPVVSPLFEGGILANRRECELIAMSEMDEPKLMQAFIDFEPNWAKDDRLQPMLEDQLRQEMLEKVPEMVSRLAELEHIMTHELGEYAEFMGEAQQAFKFGLWRAVGAGGTRFWA